MRASPLTRVIDDFKKKGTSSSSCSKSLFNISFGQSICHTRGKEKQGEGKVEQPKVIAVVNNNEEKKNKVCPTVRDVNLLEIEAVAVSLGGVDISNIGKEKGGNMKGSNTKIKKWTGRQSTRRFNKNLKEKLDLDIGKRQLVDVMIIEGLFKGVR